MRRLWVPWFIRMMSWRCWLRAFFIRGRRLMEIGGIWILFLEGSERLLIEWECGVVVKLDELASCFFPAFFPRLPFLTLDIDRGKCWRLFDSLLCFSPDIGRDLTEQDRKASVFGAS